MSFDPIYKNQHIANHFDSHSNFTITPAENRKRWGAN